MIFFLAGALAGAGVAWLLTSDEGKELLADLKSKAADIGKDIVDEIRKAKQEPAEEPQMFV